MIIAGRLWRVGDDIAAERILPSDPPAGDCAGAPPPLALSGVDTDLAKHIRAGDILAAGLSFGRGPCREATARCLVQAGLAAVIARSFSRAFYRHALNVGLPLIEFTGAAGVLVSGEEVRLDLAAGRITTRNGPYDFPPLSAEHLAILAAGGLLPHCRRLLNGGARQVSGS
jgi:3-isopropylmalate dehydratase small subunit